MTKGFTAISAGPVRIRRLTEADVAIMAKWLSDPVVLEFYEGRDNPHDEAKVREVFLIEMHEPEIPCIIEYEARPIGYVQFYPVAPAEYGYPPGLVIYGMDQFIGEPACWGQGIGTQMIRLMMDYLFRTCGADRITMDPVTTNLRAIRAYEKCGFTKVKLLPEQELHEGTYQDCWLMEAVRPG